MSILRRRSAATSDELFALGAGPAGDRSAIRIAHYTGYPRVSRGQRELTAIVRGATSDLRLIATVPEKVGALLRLEVGDLHGGSARETLARVVSCAARADGGFEIRVEPVVPNRARLVRRAPEAVRLES